MKLPILHLSALLTLTAVSVHAADAWGQCGGIGFSGSSACPSGFKCQYGNDWYSQCIPGSGAAATTTTKSTTTVKTTATTSKTTTTVQAVSSTTTKPSTTTSTKPTTTQPTSPAPTGHSFTPLQSGSGEATYYGDPGIGGNCMLPSPSSSLFAAFPGPVYSSGLYCGACLSVTGPKGSVTVQVIDKCPECVAGDLDLSLKAFTTVADQKLGRVGISWKVVECSGAGKLSYYWKSGSSQYWAAIQIRNHPLPITKVEITSSSADSWKTLVRQDYNYFLGEQLGSGPFNVRVTYSDGSIVSEGGVKLNVDGSV